MTRHQSPILETFAAWRAQRDHAHALPIDDESSVNAALDRLREIEDTMFAMTCAGPLDVLALMLTERRLGDRCETVYDQRVVAEAARLVA